ncbi:hypothetical protein BBJ28_00003980 [Nothophytophthora sp. Chile5]|nr:hypothetical protein BBJ28_00003980 [Nothophytophthora sp. Chile5]
MVPQAAKAKNSGNRPAPVTTSDPKRNEAVGGEAPRAMGGVGLGFSTVTEVRQSSPQGQNAAALSGATMGSAAAGHFFQVTYRDEYHPARPNSYEAYCKERLDKKKLDQVKRELGRRQREQERELWFVRHLRSEESGTVAQPESERDVDRQPKHTSEDVTKNAVEGQFEDAAGPRGGLGFSRAGLGYSRGATSEARVGPGELQASGGVDRGEADQKKAQVPTVALDEFGREVPREPAPKQDARRSEVDDELQEEVKGECAEKYGPVTKCVIYEVTGRVAPEEAVRIFVQFEREEGAGKGRGAWAVVFDVSVLYALGRLPLYSQLNENVDNAALAGLSGRFFGGRKVKATLYDETKFERMDLTGQ